MTNLNQMFIKNFKKLCDYLGENNDAIYGVLTIAASKGTFRPMFTMMDKKQEKKSRSYAAFREAMTGIIAFGSYVLTHKIVEKLAKPICQKAKILPELERVKKSLSLVTVCISAFCIIPFLGNVLTKPIMNLFLKNKKNTTLDIKEAYGSNDVIPAVPYISAAATFGKLPMIYQKKFISVKTPVFAYNGLKVGG